jgi:hypothetical protein
MYQPTKDPVYASAVPVVEQPAAGVPVAAAAQPAGTLETCRGCGVQFVKPPGENTVLLSL